MQCGGQTIVRPALRYGAPFRYSLPSQVVGCVPLSVPAAIDGQAFAVDERRIRTSEEGYSRSDFLNLAETADTRKFLEHLGPWPISRAKFRIDGAGLNVIDRHTGRSQFTRPTSGEALDSEFGSGIDADTG
jgi:hypothetical protein